MSYRVFIVLRSRLLASKLSWVILAQFIILFSSFIILWSVLILFFVSIHPLSIISWFHACPCLEWIYDPKWLLFFVFLFVVFQSMITLGVLAASLSTLEQRFKLSSLDVSFVAVSCDLAVLNNPSAVLRCCVMDFLSPGGVFRPAARHLWVARP